MRTLPDRRMDWFVFAVKILIEYHLVLIHCISVGSPETGKQVDDAACSGEFFTLVDGVS